MLYGCNIASDPSGTSFVDEISRLTSADVAASDDITGNLSNGGDWELEYESGTIEVETRSAEDFKGTLRPVLLNSDNLNNNNPRDTSRSLTTIIEDISDAANTGTAVSTFLSEGDVNFLDVGNQGIGITALNNTSDGTWQFSTNGGTTFANINSASFGSTLLLKGTDRIRFQPNDGFDGSASIEFRAWDILSLIHI